MAGRGSATISSRSAETTDKIGYGGFAVSPDELPDDELKRLESEIGDLLDHAEELGGELASEVGSEKSARKSNTADAEAAIAESVESQLGAADAALSDTASELGTAPSPPKPDAQKPKKSGGIKLPPKRSKPPAGEASSGGSNQGSASQNASSSSPALKLPPRPNRGSTKSATDTLVAGKVNAPTVTLPDRESRLVRLKRALHLERVAKVSKSAAEVTAYVLERADRPFHFIGYRLRTYIGWVALVLMTATITLYLFVIR